MGLLFDGVIESWLSDEIDNDEVAIPRYRTFRHNQDRRGSGVIMFNVCPRLTCIKSNPTEFH